jgi:UDP-glucose 4-epimerase
MSTGPEYKRILVTGASGFIGSYLVNELRRRKAEVFELDVRNEKPVDLLDWEQTREFGGKLGKVDLVFHLAALMFVPYSFENPGEIYKVNLLGTLNVLELCRLYDIKKVVFASSYVYGLPQYLPVDEQHPLQPGTPYARSKLLGEWLCEAYCRDFGLKCVILRPFNVYGEGQRGDFLFPSIINQLGSGKIELMDAEPKRDFVHVNDMVEAYLKAGEYDGADFNMFNIGYGKSYSVREIVDKVVEAWGKEVNVSYQSNRRRNEIMDVVADITKARKELNWEPEIDIDQGIERVVHWYRKQFALHPDNRSG